MTVVTKQIVSGFLLGGTQILTEYSALFKLNVELEKEMSIMMTLIKIDNNSHFIITICIMWTAIFLFLWNIERKKKKKEATESEE